MESKKYNKLVNIIKGSRLTDIENKLVVTSREGRRGSIGMEEWKVQTIGCKIDSRMYCTMWGI